VQQQQQWQQQLRQAELQLRLSRQWWQRLQLLWLRLWKLLLL
jgi:hypothetical protein